jgi:hypothetical protein
VRAANHASMSMSDECRELQYLRLLLILIIGTRVRMAFTFSIIQYSFAVPYLPTNQTILLRNAASRLVGGTLPGFCFGPSCTLIKEKILQKVCRIVHGMSNEIVEQMESGSLSFPVIYTLRLTMAAISEALQTCFLPSPACTSFLLY